MKLSLSLILIVLILLSAPLFFASSGTAEDVAAPPIRSISEDLPYDENGKLTSHFLLYPAKTCPYVASSEVPYGFEMRAVEGEALATLFPITDEAKAGDKCRAVCIERGVDKRVAHAVLPHKKYNEGDLDVNDDVEFEFQVWFSSNCKKAEVCVVNYYQDDPIQLYWMREIGDNRYERTHHSKISYGGGTDVGGECFSSFIGHGFQAEDGETGEILGAFTVEYSANVVFGELLESDDPEEHDDFEEEVIETLHHEWERHNNVKRTFSPLGFKKGRLPDDVFASMGAFYYNNRFSKVREEWEGKGVFVNWWETDVFFIRIPPGLNRIWAERLKELVEAWVGLPLEETSLYGMRQYENGARLLTHVDRESTHAVSLIVNIAQGNMTEPWPVEVHDHADRLHEVLMQPGDVVYYESAKALHGRNRPLTGENAYYVNLFTHYRPVGDDDDWYEKPTHEGAPDPVLDVKGECRLVAEEKTADNPVGIGTVVCDDKRLGSYVSPSLFTASSGDDLVEWWRQTAPEEAEDGDEKDEL